MGHWQWTWELFNFIWNQRSTKGIPSSISSLWGSRFYPSIIRLDCEPWKARTLEVHMVILWQNCYLLTNNPWPLLPRYSAGPFSQPSLQLGVMNSLSPNQWNMSRNNVYHYYQTSSIKVLPAILLYVLFPSAGAILILRWPWDHMLKIAGPGSLNDCVTQHLLLPLLPLLQPHLTHLKLPCSEREKLLWC